MAAEAWNNRRVSLGRSKGPRLLTEDSKWGWGPECKLCVDVGTHV